MSEKAVPTGERTLDLGCGGRKAPGAVGIDRAPGEGVDIVHDLNVFPWPIPDSSFDVIRCSHILEHLPDVVRTMEEMHRIGRSGARVEIETPHYSFVGSWWDPTHVHHFSVRSFDYFTPGYYPSYSDRHFRILEKRLTFGGGVAGLVSRLIAWLSLNQYEKHWAFILPARYIRVTLEILKEEEPRKEPGDGG